MQLCKLIDINMDFAAGLFHMKIRQPLIWVHAMGSHEQFCERTLCKP